MDQKRDIIPEWIVLNNQVIDEEGQLKDLNKDKEAAKSYFLNEINRRTQFFHSLDEKLDYLIENNYYEKEFLEKYTREQIQTIYDIAYAAKFRFPTYMGAFKFYNDYALKSRDGKNFLERYEDRLAINALYHANGDFDKARQLIRLLIQQDFTPATPTLLNTGKKQRGEFVSCFLLEAGDSLNDIARISEFSMQLSKVGGGVSVNLTNLRAKGEDIKGIPNVSKGVVGVAKLLDNNFRYADQMGQRTGAGAVYLNVFHADIEDFLSTKKLNADDDIRVKTLSMGVVIPDKFIELAKENNFVIPENSFNDSVILKVGDKDVIAKFFGEGHTKDNAVGYFPGENILFGGCLLKELEAGKGYLGDANLSAWSNTVEKVKKEYPDVKIVVPGHGDYGDGKLLDYTITLFKGQ